MTQELEGAIHKSTKEHSRLNVTRNHSPTATQQNGTCSYSKLLVCWGLQTPPLTSLHQVFLSAPFVFFLLQNVCPACMSQSVIVKLVKYRFKPAIRMDTYVNISKIKLVNLRLSMLHVWKPHWLQSKDENEFNTVKVRTFEICVLALWHIAMICTLLIGV